MCQGANNFNGWAKGQVLLRNGPHASRNRHTVCASVIQHGISHQGFLNVRVGSAVRTEIARQLYKNHQTPVHSGGFPTHG